MEGEKRDRTHRWQDPGMDQPRERCSRHSWVVVTLQSDGAADAAARVLLAELEGRLLSVGWFSSLRQWWQH
ncbi:hypothetical protein E2562_027880 [Oryza meyeriana var. granulata]|uniref:Uncharacterized protein n=1 Tax=Oryza meyeriana var. granulata TaxID=110450 RepID=A0A6G1CTQ6_9ORYZ|nr:hypothetical protein E2562_027880 [Oryza meyeriana var. granulata]